MIDISSIIRDVADFPKKGIVFKDITPVLADPAAMRQIADDLAAAVDELSIEVVCGVEARGFIFGPLLSERLNASFVPIRKPGKLPCRKISRSYGLEYGKATIELHADAVTAGQKVLMVDDLLATGGTMKAACELIEELGGQIAACAFVVELCFLTGRTILETAGYRVESLVKVE